MGIAILGLDAGSSSLKFAVSEVAERPAGLSRCFDTSFHRTQPEVAQAFALPRVQR
jgi:acetate kinase